MTLVMTYNFVSMQVCKLKLSWDQSQVTTWYVWQLCLELSFKKVWLARSILCSESCCDMWSIQYKISCSISVNVERVNRNLSHDHLEAAWFLIMSQRHMFAQELTSRAADKDLSSKSPASPPTLQSLVTQPECSVIHCLNV